MQATTVVGCGLPAMPTRLRTVELDVKSTASKRAVLDGVAHRGGRRGGPHGAVGGDVVDLPAHLLQAGDEGVGGDVGPRQEDPVDRVEVGVEVGPLVEQARARTARRSAPGRATMPQSRSAWAVTPPTAATLSPANERASRPNSSNFSRIGAHGVDRGEADPLVAAGHHALDGALELLRRAGRLDRDGRHDGRLGTVVLEPGDRRAGLLLGARHEHLPAEQRLGLEPRQRLAHGHSGPHDGQYGEAPVGHRSPRRHPRVVTTVRCSVLVPRSVTATGVSGVTAGGDEGVERLARPGRAGRARRR